MDLSGKVAIVTGGAAGIGLAISESFVQSGATVVVADVDSVEGQKTADRLCKLGNCGSFILTNVACASQVEDLVRITMTSYHRVDVLVNNAGITEFKSLIETTARDWDRLMNIDLKGAFLCTKAVLPHMIVQGAGVILNISSNHAFATLPNSEVYAAAKGGLIAFTQGVAQSYGSNGVRALAICPGYTDTPHYRRWLDNSPEQDTLERATLQLHPLGRIIRSEDIGRAAAFLASDDAAMITGTSVVIDGGVLTRLHF